MARILVITQRIPYPPNKGEKLRSFHQIAYLCGLGHKVTVLSPVEKDEELKNAEALRKKLSIKVITQTLSHKLIRFASGIIKGRSLSEANFYSKQLQQLVNQHGENCDVILCSASSLAKYVFKLNRKNTSDYAKPLLLMDFMDVDSDKWLQYAQRSSWPMSLIYTREHTLIKQLEQQCIGYFDHGFIIAQAEYQLFQSSVKQCDNLHILGNGIDQTVFKPFEHNHSDKTPDTKHFLFTGVMDYKPNVDAVLWFVSHCWPDIKKSVPEAKLIVAGMDPVSRITALTADPSIEVTGFVENIIPYFNQADVFIAPFQISRGVQNKVLQAMSCAIPLVSTSIGAEGIKAEHDHNMLIADTAEAFKAACVLLADDADKSSLLGANANRTISDYYSWEGVLLQLRHIIDKHGAGA